MKDILVIISNSIDFIVGLICLLMAYKSIFSNKFLPFHEEAYGKSWETIDLKLQLVILTIMKISGLGFLVVGLLLIVSPILNLLAMDPFSKFGVPAAAIIYSLGLFIFNYQLYKKTNASTPWKGSMIIAIVVLFSLIILAVSEFL
ncbi:MAG: hypothetical protein WCF96_03165 [Eubacteriales bacterium]